MLVLFLGSLAFVVLGFYLHDKDSFIGIANVVFFGLCGLVGAVHLHPRASYLEITEQGFAFSSLFRRHSVPWRDVEVDSFVPISVQGRDMVGWNFVPTYQQSAKLRKLSVAIAGVEAAVPDTYGMRAEELAVLLNELLVKYRGRN